MASQPSQEAQQDRKKKGCCTYGHLPLRHPIDWTDIHQTALETLIDLITSAPVMTYPDFPLTYVLSSAKLNATGLRWIGELADFNFTNHYRPGKN